MGNLYDFDPAQHIVPVQELPQMERFLLHRLHTMSLEITTAYEEFNFLKAQSLLMQVCLPDLAILTLPACRVPAPLTYCVCVCVCDCSTVASHNSAAGIC
jgi:isoleucyl-tRNA synthetase